MRIGELLLLKEKIDPWLLSHTLKEQAATRQRLVSLLVSRAQLDPDDGALLLSEQLGYPAALQRHLERRDPAVLELLPRPLGARWVVLPLARARTGAVVVVARDPTPILSAALEHAMKAPVVLSVTPSIQLERMVRAAYGVETTSEEPLPQTPPTLSDIGNVRVEDETPLPVRRPRTVSILFKGLPETSTAGAPARSSIEATLEEVDRAITAIGVERLVMGFVGKRWSTSLLARIVDGKRAVGLRGHGPALRKADAIALSLDEPSSISLARGQRRIVSEQPDTPAQRELGAVLGANVVTAPVIASGEVVAVLAVGEPIGEGGTDAINDLDRLVDALGAAYDRFAR
jgi:hypothetical protein